MILFLAFAFIFLPLTSAAKDFNLKNASDSLFFVNGSSGNVGIGTTGPSNLLDLGTSFGAAAGDADAKKLAVYQSAGGTNFYGLGVSSGLLEFHADSTTTESPQMVLRNSGNVGIGTTSPSHLFNVVEVKNAITGSNVDVSELSAVLRGNSNDNQATGIGFGYSADSSNVGGAIIHKRVGSDSYGDLHFATKPSGGATGADIPIRMTILSSGNIGIGTTGPQSILHLNGGTGSLSTGLNFGDGDTGIYEGADDELYIELGGSANKWWITSSYIGGVHGDRPALLYEGASNTNPTLVPERSDANTGIGAASAGVLSLIAGGTNGLNVISTGNIGIGTTGPNEKLDVEGNIRLGDGGGGVYLNFDTDSLYIADEDDSPVVMTLQDSGNVGIGTTSPNAKLHVESGDFQVNGSGSANGLFFNASAGEVGIGTTDPLAPLHINSTNNETVLRLQDTDGACLHNPEAGSETVSCSSDIELKENIREAKPVLDEIEDIEVKDYTVKASGKETTGVIAQEIKEKHPELVHEENGEMFVQQPNPWKLLKAIQELKNRIDKLSGVNTSIKPRLSNLSLNLTSNLTKTSLNITIDPENIDKKTIQTRKGPACVFMKNGIFQSFKGKCNESQFSQTEQLNETTQDLSNLTTLPKTQKPKDTNKQVIEDNKNINNLTQDKKSKSINETNESTQETQKPENNKEQVKDNNISNNKPKDKAKESESDQIDEQASESSQSSEKEKTSSEKNNNQKDLLDTNKEQEKEPEDVEVKSIGITGNIVNFFKLTGKAITGFIVKQEPETTYADEFDTLAINNIQELKQENLKLKQKSEALENQLKILKQELCIQNPWHTWC